MLKSHVYMQHLTCFLRAGYQTLLLYYVFFFFTDPNVPLAPSSENMSSVKLVVTPVVMLSRGSRWKVAGSSSLYTDTMQSEARGET